MASRTIAPSSDTKSAGRLKLFWLMVPTPKSGVSKNPASKAPITPTTMLRNTPCCASVPMMRLATHPRMPPMMSHRMKFILSLLFAVLTPPVRLRISTVPHVRRQGTTVRLLLQRHRCKCRTHYDGNSAYPLISRELFFSLLHFERNHGFVTGSCTSKAAPYENN